MRRRNAYILIGGLLLSIVAYLLWAARPFLIKPDIVFDPAMPAKERKIVSDWVKESGGYGSERFRWSRYIHLLMRPYEDAVIPAETEFLARGDSTYHSTPVIRIDHPYKPYYVRIVVDDVNHRGRTSVTFH